ncbi:MAG: tetratricopeptide repeat protein [Terriglobia bacterium]|nr:tetratricopeptide repeat protein [Terriglobia bacterium]
MARDIDSSNTGWGPAQAYGLAAICLLAGLPLGYMIRGSKPPSVAAAPIVQPAQAVPDRAMPTLEQMKHMADKQAEPLVAKLKQKPNDSQLLIQTGSIYMRTHQFEEAAGYFRKALEFDPKNYVVRANLASCLFYGGDPDGALAELQQNLKYDPKHAGTLLNIGIIKWKGKDDVAGALAAWEELLKLNPNFEHKDQVTHLIEAAKQQLAAK